MQIRKNIIIIIVFIIVAAITATICYWFWQNQKLPAANQLPVANIKSTIKEKKYIQLLFVGDLMFDRGIRYYAEKNGGNNYIFDKIHPLLAENDLVVANLEGTITENKSISSGTIPGSTNNYFFTFDPGVARTLFENNIKLVNLGNNHITNFGANGIKSTEKYLDEANVGYFGAPGNKIANLKVIGDQKIAFISFDQFNANDSEAVIAKIKEIKLIANFVFIFCHWGNEYELTATAAQRDLAHKFIDVGADLVIGSHPHVIQQMEEYNGKRIYYSLGNFVFDQYFDENVRNGLGVVIKIDKTTKQLNFSEKHFYLQSGGQTVEKSAEK